MEYNLSRETLKKSGSACLLVTLMLWLTSLPISAAPSQPTYWSTVHGTVIDEEGAGMSNVVVQFYTASGALIYNFSTGVDGSFSISIQYGTWNIYFTKLGYAKEIEQGIEVQKPDTDLSNIILSKALQLSTSTLSLVANQGKMVTIPFTVSNIGDYAEAAQFLISNSEGWSVTILDQSGNNVRKVYASPGQSSTFKLEVTVPLTATANEDYNVSLIAIGTCSHAGSVGTTNSSLVFLINVQPWSNNPHSSNNILSCDFPGRTVAPGNDVQFQATVSNPVDVEQRFTVSIAPPLPSGWIIQTKSTSGEPMSEVDLRGGGSAALIVDVSTPPSVIEGEYKVLLTASSSSMSGNLELHVIVQRPASAIVMTAVPPYLDVYAGSQGRFKITVSNVGGYDELLNLTAVGLPLSSPSWFEDETGKQITKLYVEAGQSKIFYAVVSTPTGTRLGSQSFSVSAGGTGMSSVVNLTLNVLGLYQTTITNTNFYTSLNVGGQGAFNLTVSNNGTEELTNMKAADVTSTVPDGFTVSIDPTSVSSLGAGQQTTFIITITTQPSVNAGNYYIDFNVRSDQTQAKTFTLRVELLQQTSWMIYGLVLIVVAVVGLFLVYRRFGRR